MKKSFAIASLFISLLFCDKAALCQKNKQKSIDSVLEASSEKWKVKPHRGMFGMSKPEFGPYTTVNIEKSDSPVLRKRTKEGSYSGASITSEGWDWDFSKYQIVEKRKAYRMLFANRADTAEMLFSIYRISDEKKLTFFGELMSKNDEGKNMTLGYKTNISGVLATGCHEPWRFFIEDSFGRKQETFAPATKRIARWYLVNDIDSIYTEPMMSGIGSPGDKYFWESQSGVFVRNATGNRIAALRFENAGSSSSPFYAWIRKDIDPVQQHAIAALLALLIIAKTY